MKRIVSALLLTLGLALAAASPVIAQEWPARPIKVIIPYPPGGQTDIVARWLGEKLSPIFGQPFVMENRPGAQAIVGISAAKQAPADGYTIVFVTTSNIIINTFPYSKPPYDRLTDFQRFLAAPPQTPKSGMAGEQLFLAIGCAACHVATPYLTGPAPEAALANRLIKPYSDYLLHDMGALGDGIVQGQGRGPEFYGCQAIFRPVQWIEPIFRDDLKAGLLRGSVLPSFGRDQPMAALRIPIAWLGCIKLKYLPDFGLPADSHQPI